MSNQTADIICILDESGSMGVMGPEPVQALNTFLNQQKQIKGSLVSLYTFGTDVRVIMHNVSLDTIGEFKDYHPDGCTALYDCIMRAIEDKMNSFPERQRNVVFVIITDGKDNHSNYKLNAVKEKIASLERNYNWQFIYLAANQNAFEEAKVMNISYNRSANYQQRPGNLLNLMRATSDSITDFRQQSQQSQNPDNINLTH